jgi:galactokinase
MVIRAFAPGRVNLIGDHTDYTGGLAMPMAIHLGTTVSFAPGGTTVSFTSEAEDTPVEVPLPAVGVPAGLPRWGRYVAAVVAELQPRCGGAGRVTTTLPVGAGLSSSAALELAVALVLGFADEPRELALLCQRAEQAAVGVPCGLMDQLTSAQGVEGHALLLDCGRGTFDAVPLPREVEVVAVHSGVARTLAGSAYAERRRSCQEAASRIGPLRAASVADLDGLHDDLLARRARHVITENRRVAAFAEALGAGELGEAGRLMTESHRSLQRDFEVSTPALDALVSELSATDGVYGARLTGAGFGGCVVALTAPGALRTGWRLEAVGGARLLGA